ncbi:hypothetical protein C8Q80DRAFT_1265418 [Daedaleopsis nitida]|nr:hypothetical protein C8Q80DRAFT_1265418 [Daedaleopsis nitida]
MCLTISSSPYIPPIDPLNACDTQNFDDTFLGMEPVINDENEESAETDQEHTDSEDSVTTPSHWRSPSVHPVEDNSVDVFDGYSFKGRHPVILDDKDKNGDGEDEEDEKDKESVSGSSLDDLSPDELDESRPTVAKTVSAAATHAAKDANVKTAPRIRPTKQGRNCPKKSGIPALDKDLPDTAMEDEGATEREEDEDGWDFVKVGGILIEECNGTKGTSLFARGVVNRYKLAGLGAVRVAHPIGQAPPPPPRTPGLTFRKHPKQFLQQKSPAIGALIEVACDDGVHSVEHWAPDPVPVAHGHVALAQVEGVCDLDARHPERHRGPVCQRRARGNTIKGSPAAHANANTNRVEEKQQKNKVLKTYKKGTEKVLSIFQSPR